MIKRILKIHASDNVAVALEDLKSAQVLDIGGDRMQLKGDIPMKHKFTLDSLKSGDSVRMYGVMVGKAQTDLVAGSLVDTRNLKHSAEPYRISGGRPVWHPPNKEKWKGKSGGFHSLETGPHIPVVGIQKVSLKPQNIIFP